MRSKVFICLLLAGVTLAIYWPARHFTFVYYDDPYFLQAPQVEAGISPEGIDWATKAIVASNWHPITTFSFLLMHEFLGSNPGAEHLVNVLFHTANVVLLFLVLLQLTGATWRSGIVAAIFAWHPLHVESVAWISERKDVLFTFFMLLSLWCYTLYAQAEQLPGTHETANKQGSIPTTSGQAEPRPTKSAKPGFLSQHAYYNLAFLFFILSFLCKATVVTLPFLLLLLDYWPLQRAAKRSEDGRLRSTVRSLLFEKWRFFAASAFLCVLTYWFHKTTADIHLAGEFTIGNRIENALLSYVNYLGKFFWPVNLAIPYPYPQSFDVVQVLLATLLLLAISAFCILQLSRRPYLAVGWFWYLVSMLPVIGLVQIGTQAMDDRHTYISLIGPSLSLVWLVGEWMRNHPLWKYLALSATAVTMAVCAFLTEMQLQLWKDTATLFSHTLAVTPENPIAEEVLALGLQQEGLLHQAAVHYRIAISSHQYSDHFMSNFRMAGLMKSMGYDREAEARLEAALKIIPNSTDAMNNLAWSLATAPDAKARNGARAVQWAERACDLTHYENPVFMTTLAAAYAEAGRFDDAVDMTQKTIALANQYGLDALAESNQELLQTYSAHQTYAQTHSAPQGAVQSP